VTGVKQQQSRSSRRSGWSRLAVAALIAVALGTAGCGWKWKRKSPEAPIDPLAPIAQRISASELEVDLRGVELENADRASLIRLYHVSRIFYRRLAHRRINSIATFHDPALREFLRDTNSFADYYADLVQALAVYHFESNRPTSVEVLDVEVEEGGERVRMFVKFVGENALPLRPWSVRYLRVDTWEYSDDRWWIIPGKV